MSEMPVLQLPEAPSFMVVDGQTFLVEKVAQTPVELLKNVQDFYEANLQTLKEQVSHHVSQENIQDLDRQVARIERHLKAGIVVLPDNLRTNGTIMMLESNKLYETRIILFRPTRISCTMQQIARWVEWIEDELSKRDGERYSRFVEWAKPLMTHLSTLPAGLAGVKVDLTVTQDLVIEPMIVSYVPASRHIFVRPGNKHCHAHSGSCHLCTGNTTAEDFWNDPQFAANFNSINPHSFANSSTEAARQLKNMFRNQYFVQGQVRESEVSAWRVS